MASHSTTVRLPVELLIHIADYLAPEDLLLLVQGLPFFLPLLTTTHLKSQDEDGKTIANLIVDRELEEMIKSPLAKKIWQTSLASSDWIPPLHQAVYNENITITQLLLEAGANIPITNSVGSSALHEACEYNLEKMVPLLLEYGGDPSARDDQEQTPLITSVLSGGPSLKILRALTDAGADLNVSSSYTETPLWMAACPDNPNDLYSQQVCGLLLDAGADPSIVPYWGETILMRAAYRGYTDVVLRLLLDTRVDISAQDDNGWTALMWAAHGGTTQSIKLLLEAGVDPAVQTISGANFLNIAIEEGYEITVLDLLDAGIDISEQDSLWNAAINYAIRFKPDFVDMLKMESSRELDFDHDLN